MKKDGNAFYETSEFKKLEKEWLDKIKDQGFVDLEPRWNRDSLLNCSTGPTSLAIANGQEDYYRIASYVLHASYTPGNWDYEVWELHCSGLSERVIAAKMNCARSKVTSALKKGKKLIKAYRLDPEDSEEDLTLLPSESRKN